MPIYEYLCSQCGQRFEALVRHPDDADAKTVHCTTCGSEQIKRLVASHTHFQLHGTGWYETDFKNHTDTPPTTGGDKSGSSKST